MTTIATTEVDYTLFTIMMIVTLSFFAIFLLTPVAVKVAEVKFYGSWFDRKSNTWMKASFPFAFLFFVGLGACYIAIPQAESVVSDLGVISYSEGTDLRIPHEGDPFTLNDVTVRDEHGNEHKYATLTLIAEGSLVSLVSQS